MKDAIISLLILALLISWFSICGPIVPADGRGLGPGDDQAGESPLVVSGSGAEIVTVTQNDGRAETQTAQGPEETQDRAGEPDERQEPEEEHMDNVNALIWYVVGVMTVLIGEFAGVVVACAWQKLREKHKEE